MLILWILAALAGIYYLGDKPTSPPTIANKPHISRPKFEPHIDQPPRFVTPVPTDKTTAPITQDSAIELNQLNIYPFSDGFKIRALAKLNAFVEHSAGQYTGLRAGNASIESCNNTFMDLKVTYDCCELGFSIARHDENSPIRLIAQTYRWRHLNRIGHHRNPLFNYILKASRPNHALECKKNHEVDFAGHKLVLFNLRIQAFTLTDDPYYLQPSDECQSSEELTEVLTYIAVVIKLLIIALLFVYCVRCIVKLHRAMKANSPQEDKANIVVADKKLVTLSASRLMDNAFERNAGLGVSRKI